MLMPYVCKKINSKINNVHDFKKNCREGRTCKCHVIKMKKINPKRAWNGDMIV